MSIAKPNDEAMELSSSRNNPRSGSLPSAENSPVHAHIFRNDSRIIEASEKDVVCRIPRNLVRTHNAHTNHITSLSWNIPKLSYLFLSTSRDGTIKIWDLYRPNVLKCINAKTALKVAKWSLDGAQIIAGGNEKKAFVYDVHFGRKIVQYDTYNYVYSMECHPYMEDVFIVGTKNGILGFDLRVDTSLPVRVFYSQCNEVIDIAFLDENEFICSTNSLGDDTIMAWDFGSGAKLANKIYSEHYLCPFLKVHPSDSTFIAQTCGSYIRVFSTKHPHTMQKTIFMGHKLSMSKLLECDISPDGKYVVSGNNDGSLYFYNYSTTHLVHMTPKQNGPTYRLKWHPLYPTTMISSTSNGQIQIWK